MKIIFIFGVSIVLIFSCKAQKQIEIIDSVTSMPYEVIRDSISCTLPDSLGGASVKGFFVLKMTIDSHLTTIKNVQIKKLKIIQKKDELVLINYPVIFLQDSSLTRYNSFFYEYCHSLRILKKYSPQYKFTEVSILTRMN